ncbi:MAG: hypothetical protein RQ867_04050 [Mariprofundaceae bacterium]|nr:hypothetical protein [Mariprofundaceae bacterium]
MHGKIIPILPDGLAESEAAEKPVVPAHNLLRIYQLFVNVEGLEVRIHRPVLGFIPFIKKREFGFYAVMMLAAPVASKPPFLLGLAREALAEEFAPISRSAPDDWRVEQVEWREAGAAPPMFRQPGCVDQDWGAAWYELKDQAAKQHRYRLAKARLWKGRRAKQQHNPVIETASGGGKEK